MRRYKEDIPEPITFYTKLPKLSINSAILESLSKKRYSLHTQLENLTSSTKTINNTSITPKSDDILSHFGLKLVSACNLHTLTKFIRNECSLFLKKLDTLDTVTLENYFFTEFIMHLSNLEIQNNTLIIPYNSSYTLNTHKYNLNLNSNLTIHFSKIINIISTHFPQQGYIHDARKHIKFCIYNFFKEFHTKHAHKIYHKLKSIPDERIIHIHNLIYTKTLLTNTITNSLSQVAKYFPPCISGIITKLQSLKHLKYKDRLILVNFLRNSNVPVEATINLFKENFNVPERVFVNKYLYSIRHAYGLEGKKATYGSYDCKRIIESYDNETFGCPFKNNRQYLKTYAEKMCVDIEDMTDCQSSCTRMLEKMCGQKDLKIIVKPIDFVNVYSLSDKEKKNIVENN